MAITLLLAIAVSAAVAAPSAASSAATSPAPIAGPAGDDRPKILKEVGIDQKLGAAVPLDLAFKDETGRDVRLRDYFGSKPVILTLNYYECPMLCTLTLNGLVSALRAVILEPGKDFNIVTVSINPKEGPALAKAKKESYVRTYAHEGADGAWHFLTGEQKSIEALAGAVGFRYTYDAEAGQYAHAAGIIVLTPDGHVSRYFYGVEFIPRDVRLGLVDASAGKIGTITDAILLFCYHYDPSTGKYTGAALTAMRLGGIVTIALIVAFFLFSWRRESRRAVARPA
jgi:protein SCO1/2